MSQKRRKEWHAIGNFWAAPGVWDFSVRYDDDHQILRRSLRDPRAFDELFDRHFAAVHRFARHCLGASGADDIASETFLRAFAARHRYAQTSSDARAWPFAIASNLVRDEVRRRGRVGGLHDRLGAQPAPPGCFPDAGLPDPRLQAALRALREPEREALLLFAWAELSYEEIAEVTQTAVGTVRSRLSRARANVRAHLDAHGAPQAERTP